MLAGYAGMVAETDYLFLGPMAACVSGSAISRRHWCFVGPLAALFFWVPAIFIHPVRDESLAVSIVAILLYWFLPSAIAVFFVFVFRKGSEPVVEPGRPFSAMTGSTIDSSRESPGRGGR